MKKLLAIITLCLMCVGFCVPFTVMAEPPLLVDEADLLSDEEEAEILAQLQSASAKFNTDVIAVTTNGIGTSGDSYDYDDALMTYSDYYILNNGYGQGEKQDAILFMIDIGGRGYHFSTHGETIYAFTDDGIEQLKDTVSSYLRNGDYAGAIRAYDSTAEEMLAYKAEHGTAMYETVRNSPGRVGVKGVISLVIGFIISFMITGKMKSELKSVRSKASAADYFDAASMRLTGQKETFLYNNITRIPINRESKGGGGFSTHSTGGSSFGGGGGRF